MCKKKKKALFLLHPNKGTGQGGNRAKKGRAGIAKHVAAAVRVCGREREGERKRERERESCRCSEQRRQGLDLDARNRQHRGKGSEGKQQQNIERARASINILFAGNRVEGRHTERTRVREDGDNGALSCRRGRHRRPTVEAVRRAGEIEILQDAMRLRELVLFLATVGS